MLSGPPPDETAARSGPLLGSLGLFCHLLELPGETLGSLLGSLRASWALFCVLVVSPVLPWGLNFGLPGSVLGRPRAPWWTAGHIMHTILMCLFDGFLDYMRLVFPFNCVAYVGGGRVGMDRTSFCVRDTLIDHPPTPHPTHVGRWYY